MRSRFTPQTADTVAHPGVCVRGWAAVGLAVRLALLGVAPAAMAAEPAVAPAEPTLIRLGIAPGTWWGVNPNDASAAITAWARTIFRQRNLQVDVQTRMFETPEALHEAIKHGEVDGASMLTDQFLGLEPELQPEAVFIATKNREFTERYMLLAHRGSGLTNVSGLPARNLLLQTSARTSLAPYWIETLFARHSLGAPATALKSLTRLESSSKPVLQVFFRQADACVVTASVFDLASELNPQLRKELVVLATSPPVIPALFFFPPAFKAKVRVELEQAILTLSEGPAGQQVLTVFQGDGMLKLPLAVLEESRQLLAEHNRLSPGAEAPKPASAGQEVKP